MGPIVGRRKERRQRKPPQVAPGFSVDKSQPDQRGFASFPASGKLTVATLPCGNSAMMFRRPITASMPLAKNLQRLSPGQGSMRP